MERDKPDDRGMIRCRLSLKKIHEVDIPPAGTFDIPAGIDPVHGCIDDDLKHLTRRRLTIFDLTIGLIKISQFHVLHKYIQQADRVIVRDQNFHFKRKFELIIE